MAEEYAPTSMKAFSKLVLGAASDVADAVGDAKKAVMESFPVKGITYALNKPREPEQVAPAKPELTPECSAKLTEIVQTLSGTGAKVLQVQGHEELKGCNVTFKQVETAAKGVRGA